MKKLSAILAMVLAFAISVVPAYAAGAVDFTVTASKATVDPGETFTITVSHNSTVELAGINMTIPYDDTKLEFISGPGSDINADGNKQAGVSRLKFAASVAGAMKPANDWEFTFKAKEDATGEVRFDISVVEEAWDVEDEDCEIGEFTGASVKIGSEPEPAVFTVTAVDNGANTVVTVANKGELTGLVYAASYDANNVLVNCAPAQALADGTLTFTGITGNVKVFVWDANNAPLLDAFVTATAQ